MTETQTNTFNFELVSPEEKLLSEPAWQVTIPGEEGYFGVLAGHSSLVSAIRPGVVEVFAAEGEEPKRIFIAGGFADVIATNCTVLAEEAVNVNDLDAAALDQQIQNLTEDLNMAQDDIEKARIQKNIDLATAKRNAISA